MDYLVFFTTFDESGEIVIAIDVAFDHAPTIADLSGILSLICSDATKAVVSVHDADSLNLLDLYEVGIYNG